jgi:DNA repair exonuclease SbcCD ATPase subunit
VNFGGIEFEEAPLFGESSEDNPYKGKDLLLETSAELGKYKARYNFLLEQFESKNQEIARLEERISELEDELMGSAIPDHEVDY